MKGNIKRYLSAVVLLGGLGGVYGAAAGDALCPTKAPGANFDLTCWKLTLPDASEIKETKLANGAVVGGLFNTAADGGMVFKCPNQGETTSKRTKYSRCELREMLRRGNTKHGTKGITKNNWLTSTSSAENKKLAGGIDGTLRATLKVDHVSESGKKYMIGRVIVGQIHAAEDEPCRLYYRKLPGNSKGSIYFAHERPNTEDWHELIGSRGDSADDPADGIALGEKWSYEIKLVGRELTVRVKRPGKPDVAKTITIDPAYDNDPLYFKAGVYNQNNGGDAGDHAQATFYALTAEHN